MILCVKLIHTINSHNYSGTSLKLNAIMTLRYVKNH